MESAIEELLKRRMSGKTTRMTDYCIQQLFTKGEIYIPNKEEFYRNQALPDYQRKKGFDDWIVDPDYMHGNAQLELRKMIFRRLESEHPNVQVTKRTNSGWIGIEIEEK